MPRIKLRKKYGIKSIKNKLTIFEKIMIIIILLFISLFFSLKYISMKVTPSLMKYAEIETKRFVNIIINKAISESNIENVEDIISVKEENGYISSANFNVNVVNKMLSDVTGKIERDIKLLEDGNLTIDGYDDIDLKKGVIYRIRGGLFNNNIFTTYGPGIPVKIRTRGNITANIDTKLTNYGINNALIELSIKLVIEEQISLPLVTKTIMCENEIPIAIKLVSGSVPKYYSGGIKESSPMLTVPIED